MKEFEDRVWKLEHEVERIEKVSGKRMDELAKRYWSLLARVNFTTWQIDKLIEKAKEKRSDTKVPVEVAGDTIAINAQDMKEGTASIVDYQNEKVVVTKEGEKVRVFKLMEEG